MNHEPYDPLPAAYAIFAVALLIAAYYVGETLSLILK